MPIGISGSNAGASIGPDPVSELQLIEARVTSNLLNSLLGTNQAIDPLETLRNDAAFALGIPVPLPGAGM